MKKIRLLLLLGSAIIAAACASHGNPDRAIGTRFRNPLDVSSADPQILKDDDGRYYLYGTTDSDHGFRVSWSDDLVHWREHGFCWRKTETSYAQKYLWAPEAIKKGNKYYLFYTGAPATDHRLRTHVAVADSPLGPFEDLVAPLIEGNVNIFDPSPFHDPATGDYYLYYTKDTTQSGSDRSEIWGGRLNSDFTDFAEDPVKCIEGSQEWERSLDGSVYFIEGQHVLHRNGHYYMQYAGSAWYSPSYGLGIATATHPLGPWTKVESNPLLTSGGGVFGPGHGSFTTSPDGAEDWIVYHDLVTSERTWARQLNIDRIHFDDSVTPPRLIAPGAPTRALQPLPSGARPFLIGQSDDFQGPLDLERWRIFGENPDHWAATADSLRITLTPGTIEGDRPNGRNIFLQYAPSGDFMVETSISFEASHNNEQAFLIVWQDQSYYIKIGFYFHDWLFGRNIEVGSEQNAQYTREFHTPTDLARNVRFRIQRRGAIYNAAYSADGVEWTEAGDPILIALSEPLKVGIGTNAPDMDGRIAIAEFDYLRITPLDDKE